MRDTSHTPRPARTSGGIFPNSGFGFIALFILALCGFWKPYLAQKFAGIDRYTHIHAALMTIWCGFLIAQAFLIRFGKREIHRALGKASYILAPIIMVSVVLLAHHRIAPAAKHMTPDEAVLLFISFGTLALFSVMYVMAMVTRKTPALHARFMIGSSLSMIGPALARVIIFLLPTLPFRGEWLNFGLTDLIPLTLILFERKQKRGRLIFPAVLGCFVIYQIGTLTVASSETWRRFAVWFASLPIT